MVLSDRIAVIRGGELQQLGPPMEVYRNPGNLFVASFIGSPAMNMLEAAVQTEGDALLAHVAGQVLRLPHSAARTTWTGERKALLGIRPTDLGIAAPDAAELRGTVFLVEPVGPFAYVDVEIGGWAIKATTDPDSAPAIGDTVGLSVTPGRACLFDPGTEARL